MLGPDGLSGSGSAGAGFAEAPGTAVLAMSLRWSPPLVEAALAAGARG
ncbi:helix-turn-helix transcriptional regulator, partial [Micromonospora sp. Rc5]